MGFGIQRNLTLVIDEATNPDTRPVICPVIGCNTWLLYVQEIPTASPVRRYGTSNSSMRTAR